MEIDINGEVKINGEVYVKKGSLMAEKVNGMRYVIVRTYSAGVFVGYIESRNGQEVVMRNVRRIWCWYGATSLSELAVAGTCDPENCKFSEPVDREELLQAIEILDVTEAAKKSIAEVKEWKKR